MHKKGFTLIELLAVVVITAIIALISLPIIIALIEGARKQAFVDTGYSIIKAGEFYYSKGEVSPDVYDLVTNNVIPFEKGNLRTGQLKYDENGNVAIAIWDGNYCVVKDYTDTELTVVSNEDGTNCNIEKIDKIINSGATGYLCSNPGSVVATPEMYFTFNQATKTITGYSNLGPKNVVIPCTIGGVNVEAIGSSAFASKSLTSVIMPDTIKTIGTSAFAYNQINSLELGNGIVTLEKGSFYENKLTEVILPDSLKTIASGGIYSTDSVFGKNQLTRIVFGSGIETIGSYAFTATYSIGMYGYSDANPITEVIFSRSTNLKTIGDGAFYSTNIISLNLSKSTLLNTIGASAFAQADITSLSLNGTNLNIASGSFSNNKIADLIIDGNNITIGSTAFANNFISSLSLIGNITNIGNDAFKNNQLPNNNAFIYGRNGDGTTNTTLVSYGGANRSNVIIPDTITSLSNATFTSLGLNGTLNTGNGLTTIESSKFSSNALTNVIIGSSVTTIGASAFSNNVLATVTIGNNVTSIGTSAFAYNQISSLSLGNGIVTLEKGSFYDNRLTEVVLPNSLKTIASGGIYSTDCVFGKNRLTRVVFGSGIETIGAYAFTATYSIGMYGYSDANPITEVDFSRSTNLKTIGDGAFYSTNIVDLDLSESTLLNTIGTSAFAQADIVSLSLNGTNLNIVSGSFSSNKIADLTINGNNITIGASAFANNFITSLSLVGNITNIGNDAFKNNQLPDATAFIYGRNSDGTTNTTLVSYAGAKRSNVTIPDTITSLSNATFNNLGLTGTLNTGNGLTKVESSKFSNNTLTGVIIGSSVTTIESSAFSYNTLTNITLSSSVTTIGQSAFSNNALVSVTIGNNVTSIGTSAFAYNQISSLSLGNGIVTLEKGSFFDNKLTEVVLPDSLKTIANGGIYSSDSVFGKNRLARVVFGSGIETIGTYAFTATYSIGMYGYSDANPITEVDFSRATGLKTIGDGAFYSTNIVNLDLSQNTLLNTIGTSAFAQADITSLSLNGTNLNIVSGSFSNNKIADLTINGNNVTIGASAFANNLITNLSLVGNIISIGNDAFKNNQLPDANAFIYGRNSDGTTNTTLVSYAGAKRSNVTIPDTITSLANATFNSLGLTGTLNTGNGLTKVESSKFSSNTLTSVIIGSSVTTIESSAFAYNTLTNVTIGSSVTTIGQSAFAYNQISSLSLGNSVVTLDKGSFYDNRLTEVILPDSLKTIASGGIYSTDSVFGKNLLTKVVLGSGLETIGAYAFTSTYSIGMYGYSNANPITEVDTSRATGLKTIGDGAFYSNKFTNFEVPPGVLTIGASALANNTSLAQILVKGKNNSTNFTSLGTSWNGSCNNIIYEFESCYAFSGNTITNYVSACSKKVEIPSTLGGNTITTIAADAFANKGLYNIVIPSGITTIGDNAFSGNTMEAIGVIGKTSASDFTSVGTNWNGGNPVAYSGNNASCFAINSGVASKYYDVSVCSRNMVIPGGVTEIAANAFVNDNLNSVTMPSSMQIIGNDPFTGNLLSSMTVLDGANFTSLGTNWKGNLLKVDFQGSSIEKNCYEVTGNAITKYQAYCPVTVVIPTSIEGTTVTSIGTNAFKNSAVRTITIGSHIQSIGDNAFENNDIVTLTLNEGLQSIGANAFKNTGLLTLNLPGTVMTIGNYAFVNNANLGVINIIGKDNASNFTSLGTNWNGTCNNINYLGN